MKRLIIIVAGFMSATIAWGASGLTYDGSTLELNNAFTRTECGTMGKKTMKEVSGLACSRQTNGYLWAHGDENVGDNRKIIAIQPDGTLAMTVNITTSGSDRDDWEDICTGVYGGKNYVFIGGIGDNKLAYNDAYYIYYFEEPAITSGSMTVTAQYIRFGYPDNKAHNTETLMYDNIEQMFYVADKVEGVCHLYKLPFRTDYGTSVQKLTEVCALGDGATFNLINGGDITPDGKWMAIKNEKYVLLWERKAGESLSETAKRQPTQIAAYKKETQGESIAWKDSTTFYTTSDAKSDTPIYEYVRSFSSSSDDPQDPEEPEQPEVAGAVLYEVVMSNHYNAYIDTAEHTKPATIHAFYLAGEEEPIVSSCLINAGTEWEQTGNTLTLTGKDATIVTYTLSPEAVLPLTYTSKELILDGSETWIKGSYGFDSSKKWRFSKTDDDFSRELLGRTHIELFLPACDTVVLKSMSKERDVRVYINGEALGGKFKLLTSGNVLAVEQTHPFMLTIASAQSSGDGGIAAIRLAKKLPTSLETTQSVPQISNAQKVVLDGKIFIERNGIVYSILGLRSR